MRNAFSAAVANISAYGDTDIFPYSIEQLAFYDRPELLVGALEEVHRDLAKQLALYPPDNIETLAPVGYTGFRWATQIDPLWNAYYLALVIHIGREIVDARLPVTEESVFSYRFVGPQSDGSIFDESVNWRSFMKVSIERAEASDFVIVCDISDFYARVYHHRIENSLKWIGKKPDTVKRIVEILKVFSGTVSYGLPVGGPASRLLAELALNSVDKLLRSEGVTFCRFVDDYRIFCSSREEAYGNLLLLSEKLGNEGLSLQKSKTRILSSKEFADEARLLVRLDQDDLETLTDEERLLRLSIRFDPYSETRVDDYERLKNEVAEIDVAGVLARELRKSRIDQAVVKQAISSLAVLDPIVRKRILASLLDSQNLMTLAPVFTRLMIVLRSLYDDLDDATKDVIDVALCSLLVEGNHIIKVDLNLAYVLQVLRKRASHEKERLLVQLLKEDRSALVRREIIHCIASWELHHLLTGMRKRFSAFSNWERRVFIVASFVLTEEGKHWRDHSKAGFSPSERVIVDWYSKRVQTKPGMP